MEIIAHRGASADAPENTLAAVRLAWAQGADAVEVDVRLTRDGRIAVFHDADATRFGGPFCPLAELTWGEVQVIEVGAWKGAQFRGEHVPDLAAVLATVPPGRRALVEIKCGPEIVPEFTRVVRSSGRAAREVAVISFHLDVLREAKRALPQNEHYLVAAFEPESATGVRPDLAPLLEQAKSAGLDGLDLQSTWPITREFAVAVKAAGLKLLVWTVDDPALAARLRAAGVDGLATNRPGWLRERLGLAAGKA